MLADGGGDLDGFILCVLAAIAHEDVDVADVHGARLDHGRAVALLPAMALPRLAQALAIRHVADGAVGCRLVVVTRKGQGTRVDAFWRPWLNRRSGLDHGVDDAVRDGLTSPDENVRNAWIGIRVPRPSSQDQQ